MLCQNCKINESTIHLYTNVNGKQHQVDLCQNCYQIMKTDPNNALFRGMTNMNNQNNLDPFDDFFSNLGNFQNHQEPQTPPTQSGWRIRQRRLWFQSRWQHAPTSTTTTQRPPRRIWYQCN